MMRGGGDYYQQDYRKQSMCLEGETDIHGCGKRQEDTSFDLAGREVAGGRMISGGRKH